MSNEKTIRLGVAGAGIAVRDLHWPALSALGERYRIVALAARSDATLEKTGELVGCDRFYHDHRAMIEAERDNLDAVLVSLPIGMLYEGARAAAEAGLDVLCEKPAGQNLEEGERFTQLAEEFGVSIQILENFRYREDLQRARELIEAGTIGSLYLVRVTSIQRALPEQGGFAGTAWRQEGDYVGGPLLDSGVHHMAAFHVLAGAASQISGAVAATSDAYEGENNAAFTIRFEGDAIGQYTFAYSAFEDAGAYSFFQARCYGTEGTLLITDGQVRVLTEEGEQEPETFPDFDNGYRNEFLDFYRHKSEGTPLRVTPAEAFADLHLLLSGIDAAREGRVLPLHPAEHGKE